MSTSRRIAKNTSLLFASSLLQKVLSLVIVIIVARALGAAGFGIYSLVFSFVFIFAVLLELGLHILAVREGAKDLSLLPRLLGDFLLIKVFLAAFAFLLIWFFSFVLFPDPLTFRLVLIAAVSLVLDSFAGIFRSFFYAVEKMEFDLYTNFVYKALALAFTLVFFYMGFGVTGFVAAMALASLFNLLSGAFFAVLKVAKPVFVFDFARLKKWAVFSLPFCFIGLVSAIFANIDIVMVSFFRGALETGFYSAAVRLTSSLAFAPVAFIASIFPVMSKMFARKNLAFGFVVSKSWKYVLLFILPTAIFITIFSGEIIGLIYGEGFLPAATALTILVWFAFFNFQNIVFSTALNSAGKEKKVFKALSSATMLNIAFNLFMIPVWGFVGAAFSSLASEAFLLLVYYAIIKKNVEGVKFEKEKMKILFIALFMLIVCFVLKGFISLFSDLIFSFSVVFVLSAVIYGVFLRKSNVFDEKDWELFEKIVPASLKRLVKK